MNGTGSGAAWARTFGVERLGELQGVGESARIGAAALGPLPLAIARSLSGSYVAALVGLATLALIGAATGFRLPVRTTLERRSPPRAHSHRHLTVT